MPKQQFLFNTFSNGLSIDPAKWKTHGYYSAGLDFVGVKDVGGNAMGTRPNVLQLSPILERDTVSGSTIVGMPYWIRKFGNNYYGLIPNTSSGGEGLLISSTGSTWVSAHYTSAGNGGGGLATLGVNALYYAQNEVLGRLSADGTYSNNFANFTNTTASPRPMKVFAGVLNIGNDNLIATVDSSGTFTTAGLTLPTGFTVRSLEVLGNYLVISADNGSFARIFLWTGGTATYQEAYDLPETTAPRLISREGRVFAIGDSIYLLNETSFQTLYPLAYIGLPATSPTTLIGSIANWKNRVLYGQNQAGGGTVSADEAGGVYMLGQYDASYPLTQSLFFLLPTTTISAGYYTYNPNNLSIGAIYTDNSTTIKVAFTDNTATAVSAKYAIASYNTGVLNSQYSYYVTLPLTMDSDNNKLFHSIRVNMTGSTGNSRAISVYYRLDTNFAALRTGSTLGAWTLLKTVKTTDDNQTFQLPIRKKGRNIMFKFQFYDSTSQLSYQNDSPQLIDYSVVYEQLDLYR